MLSETMVLTQEKTDFLPLFSAIKRWPSDRAKSWVENFMKDSQALLAINAIVVFGSVIREVEHSADLDLLVIYSEHKPSISPPIEVDVRVYQSFDVDSLIENKNEVLGWAIRFGRMLYEKNHYWTKVYSKWRENLPLPSAEEAEKRAKKAKKYFDDLKELGDEDAANEQQITMLTQLARANLIRAGIFPASRPELPKQLSAMGEKEISVQLSNLLRERYS